MSEASVKSVGNASGTGYTQGEWLGRYMNNVDQGPAVYRTGQMPEPGMTPYQHSTLTRSNWLIHSGVKESHTKL